MQIFSHQQLYNTSLQKCTFILSWKHTPGLQWGVFSPIVTLPEILQIELFFQPFFSLVWKSSSKRISVSAMRILYATPTTLFIFNTNKYFLMYDVNFALSSEAPSFVEGKLLENCSLTSAVFMPTLNFLSDIGPYFKRRSTMNDNLSVLSWDTGEIGSGPILWVFPNETVLTASDASEIVESLFAYTLKGVILTVLGPCSFTIVGFRLCKTIVSVWDSL